MPSSAASNPAEDPWARRARCTFPWFTRTAGSSAQLYWETRHGPRPQWASDVPTGVSVFPHDLFPPTRRVVEDAVDLVYWNELDRGGHFPAMEVPGLLVDELRAFARAVRTS